MDSSGQKFPFATSFQFREDERLGLEALFGRVFFEEPFSPAAREALLRTRVRLRASAEATKGESVEALQGPVEEGPGRSPAGGSPGPAATEGSTEAREVPKPARGDFLPGERPRYVLLYRGQSGIGKTRIFHKFRESARERRIPVYEVCHLDVEGIPFKPFLRAIRGILRDHDQGSALREKYRHGLEALLPELYAADASRDADDRGLALSSEGTGVGDGAQHGPSTTESPQEARTAPNRVGPLPPSESEKVRTFDAVTQLLLEVASQRPLLLLVHDLHWSDRPTLELLGYIGRNVALRNARLSPFTPRQLVSDPALRDATGAGPEVDGFESDEWRALTRRRTPPLDVIHVLEPISRTREDGRGTDVPGAGTSGAGASASVVEPETARRPKLMILANYQGSVDSAQQYVEEAIRDLGESPFAYHGELRPLGRQEARRFVERSVEGVHVEGQALEVPPDAVDAIYEVTEGFPSFTHELFRALYLREGPFAAMESPAHVWRAEDIRRAMEQATAAWSSRLGTGGPWCQGGSPQEEKGTASTQAEKESGPKSHLSPPGREQWPKGRRHVLLRLRVLDSSAFEIQVLQAMAVARRPVTPGLLCNVLDRLPGSDEESIAAVELALRSLEARGLIEKLEPDSETGSLPEELVTEMPKTAQLAQVPQAARADQAAHAEQADQAARAGGEAFFFRLWDYVSVLEETISVAERARLHLRLGEACLPRLEAEGGEVAYEVYYHLRRGPDPRASLPYGLAAADRFLRCFALEKARRVYSSSLGLLTSPQDLARRVDILEQSARISLALKESATAEDLLRMAQSEGGAALSPERKLDLVLLEAEAACVTDAAKGLRILGKAPRLLKDENTLAGIRLQLSTARARLAYEDLKRAINFALKGTTICQKVGDVPELGDLYSVLASAFYRKGEYSYAVDNYQRALDVFERLGLRERLVSTLDELGRVYLERGNYFRAARYFYKSLEVRRRQHDILGLCKSYDELGQVYLRSGDYLKTIENLNRSLTFKERTGDFAGINPTLVVLGDLYFRLGRYEQAIFYFDREVENSQRLGDTGSLVEAFKQLARVHFEIGDIKQAERLCKQVSILASEFKLRSQEADGTLLVGSIKALARDWPEAEKSFKFAAEVHGKLGHRRREVCALLNLAEAKFERELYDEALKFASKSQILADEVKALDLQVRALTIKGNIHRFLKGGNSHKAREFLQKALELSQGLSDVGTLFQLFYAMAKVCHSDREYAEASNYYGKAELILKQIGESLSDDRAARFFEDSRRKVFMEDVNRLRKEALGRASGVLLDLRETSVPTVGFKERQTGPPDYKDLLSRVLRVHSELNQLNFHERLLSEALELTGADRGFILRVQNRQYFPVAFRGFGRSPSQDPEFSSATSLLQETIRKGRAWSSSRSEVSEDDEKNGRQDRKMQFGSLVHRSILAVPFMTDERIFGGIYLDKPVAVGQFVLRDQVLLETFAHHAAVALNNRRELETAIREPLTGYYTASYFNDRLREAYRWFNLHGKTFTLAGYYLPSLEASLGDGRGQLASSLTSQLSDVLPQNAALCWGSPILYILLSEMEPPVVERVAHRVKERLASSLNDEVPMEVLPVHNRYQHGSEMYFEIRRRLLPEVCDAKLLGELRVLLADGVSLREAKKILERQKIENTLRKTGGNITHAAKELGIHRPQLSNLLKKYALKREVYESEEGETEAEDAASQPSSESSP